MDNKQSKGGAARAKALSSKQRSEIAKKAAATRWSKDMPVSRYEGFLEVGDTIIACAVLPNKQRIITQATFLRALGRSRSPKAGTGVLSTVDELPFFLQNEGFKPFITDELTMSTTPIFFVTKSGVKAVGYDARLLPRVAEVYLKFRDSLAKKGSIPTRYSNMFTAADVLIRRLADQGIISLVDEATGFKDARTREAIDDILEKFVAKELQPYVHTFPDDFYREMFRLRGLEYSKHSLGKKPQYFGHLTNDVIYARLAPSVLEELKRLTPRNSKGQHKQHLHRRLSRDVGHPKLRELLGSVVTLMKLSDDYDSFHALLERIHPKYGANLQLPLRDELKELGA